MREDHSGGANPCDVAGVSTRSGCNEEFCAEVVA